MLWYVASSVVPPEQELCQNAEEASVTRETHPGEKHPRGAAKLGLRRVVTTVLGDFQLTSGNQNQDIPKYAFSVFILSESYLCFHSYFGS